MTKLKEKSFTEDVEDSRSEIEKEENAKKFLGLC